MEHQISNEYITLTVSAKGAEMRSIEKDSVEYLWNGDPAYWADRAPLLFPYVSRFTSCKRIGSYWNSEIRKQPFPLTHIIFLSRYHMLCLEMRSE